MKVFLLGVTAFAAVVVAAWFLDVFTWIGVGAAFWPWTDTTALRWPLGTRLVWWLLAVELAVAPVAHLVHRDARLECKTYRDLWLVAHVELVKRARRRVRFAVEGAKVAVEQARRHRPAVVEQPVVAADEARDATSEERAA